MFLEGVDVLVGRYEELRESVLRERASSRRLGLALLRRQGLVAWMEAWGECAKPRALSVTFHESRGEPLADENDAAVVDVLTTMVLCCLEDLPA